VDFKELAVVAKNLALETPLLQKYQTLSYQSSSFIVKGQCVEILVLPPPVSKPQPERVPKPVR
jgi:hypothetical protein